MRDNRPGQIKETARGAGTAPLVFFILALGIFFEGGDWPPATFLIRTLLFVLAAVSLWGRDRLLVRPNAVDLLVCALWAVEGVSLARADYAWVSYQWFLHHSAALVLYLLVRAQVDPGARFPVLLGVLILLAAAAELLIGGYQRLVLDEARAWGTLQNPNFLAEFLLYGAIAAHFALKRAGFGGARRLSSLGVAVAVGVGLWLTSSRGGFLVALVVGGYVVAREVGWRRTIAVAALVTLALVLVPNPLLDRFLGKGDPYAFERLNMWEAAVRIFRDHPFGVGVGHFKYYWHVARDPVAHGDAIVRYARSATTPHSEFFSLLSELGVAGAAAFLAIGLIGLVSLRRAAREADPAVSGGCAILLASFLHSFAETNYHVPGLLLLNGAVLALVSSRLFRPLGQRGVEIRGAVRGAFLALLAAMAAYSTMTIAATGLEWRGQKLLGAGRLEEAEGRFLWAAAADPWRASGPDSVSAVRYRRYRSGRIPDDLSAAIEAEVEASRRNPLDFVHRERLGNLHAEAAGEAAGPVRPLALAAALSFYDQALKLCPRNAEVHYRKALLLRAAGRKEESLRAMEAILKEEPNFARGWVLLGETIESDDKEKAAEAYERALVVGSRYRRRAIDPMERSFLDFQVGAVETRLSELKKELRR